MTRKADVFAEIATILGLQSADTSTPGWFSKRLPAIKNVIEKMTEEEKLKLDEEVKRISKEGYPEEQKRKYVLFRPRCRDAF